MLLLCDAAASSIYVRAFILRSARPFSLLLSVGRPPFSLSEAARRATPAKTINPSRGDRGYRARSKRRREQELNRRANTATMRIHRGLLSRPEEYIREREELSVLDSDALDILSLPSFLPSALL